jgi:hypothetical protein
MNPVEMMGEFGDEAKCRAYLEKLRWPNGVACPRCKGEKIYRIENATNLFVPHVNTNSALRSIQSSMTPICHL